MRAHDLYTEINARSQKQDADSVLSWYKRLLRLRKEHKDVFIYGAFELLDADNVSTLVFRKYYEGKSALVALNFTCEQQTIHVPRTEGFQLLISTYGKVKDVGVLKPYEGRVYTKY